MIEFTWDHLQLCSADAEVTAAWFARCLNAEVVRRPGRVDLRLGSINLFITQLTGAQATETPRAKRTQGIDHFGVTVDDLDAAFAHLKACDADIVEPIKPVRAGVRALFVKSPGDILIEVLERKPSEMTFT
ncbi:hypothetical protein PEP31012_02701 [Pandoraea eparura]|jgi:hypothetical protein|uniref:VOC domain-containing protein n=1 Tax=Pandoraea eparura TaxID=2508291 RepID=A0A5E4VJ54_9BURK|nr:VOC family protein [Pandoraea eparura]VVE12322.1 hypothetical protein PEP31012_02701 [Pandoraea eparura]